MRHQPLLHRRCQTSNKGHLATYPTAQKQYGEFCDILAVGPQGHRQKLNVSQTFDDDLQSHSEGNVMGDGFWKRLCDKGTGHQSQGGGLANHRCDHCKPMNIAV